MRREQDEALCPVRLLYLGTFSNSHAFGLPVPEKPPKFRELQMFPDIERKREEIPNNSKLFID
jgi:hypothetical protein